MRYRLDDLTTLAADLGLAAERVDSDRLDVLIEEGCRLAFCNLPAEDDTLVGFNGTPWHSHDIVQFQTGDSRYIECDELDVLMGLGAGELIIVSQYSAGQLADRWIAHVSEPFDLQYMKPGDELRIFRLPERSSMRVNST